MDPDLRIANGSVLDAMLSCKCKGVFVDHLAYTLQHESWHTACNMKVGIQVAMRKLAYSLQHKSWHDHCNIKVGIRFAT